MSVNQSGLALGPALAMLAANPMNREIILRTGALRKAEKVAEKIPEKHKEKISLLQRTLEKTLTYYFTVIHGIKFDRPFVVRLIQAHTLQPHSFRTFLLST